MFKDFFIQVFKPAHALLLVFGVVGTYVCVVSGFDWWYFLFTYEHVPRAFLFVADGFGFLVPFLLCIGLYVFGKRKVRKDIVQKSYAIAFAIVAGFCASMFIKVFTGRISPPHHGPFDVDISHMFQFGFMNYQIMGGWPSSHATVMFALAACLCACFPQKRGLMVTAYSVAFFIGLGVTFGFHWFSEFLMGALLGYVLGRSVYVAFTKE